MSRTKKGSKGPGYEYWSKRPMAGSNPGAWAKKVTHKIERQRGETETRKAANAGEGPPQGRSRTMRPNRLAALAMLAKKEPA